MMYKAVISFTGKITMAQGEVREISDLSLVEDLLKAGYIVEEKETKKKSPRKEKKDGN